MTVSYTHRVKLNEDGEPRFELYVDGDLVYCGFLQILSLIHICWCRYLSLLSAERQIWQWLWKQDVTAVEKEEQR